MSQYNPFYPMMQSHGMPPMAPMQQRNIPQFDLQQFRQFAITLNDSSLSSFAQMARQKGISEQDIQEGIKLIKSL